MKFEHTQVWGLEHALRGMRNPKESWGKSDSEWMFVEDPSPINPEDEWKIVIGPNDMDLALRLIRAGSVHRKFLRQIFVSVDITAPIYWWKEFDTYKVGTTANSTSTMHKLAFTPITRQCFELDDYHGELQLIDPVSLDIRTNCFIEDLEQLRQLYLQTKDKKYWKELIRWLPSGWLQTRTVTMTYENLVAMCSQDQRRHHKLSEWREAFVEWARTLPYAQEFIFFDELPDDPAVVKSRVEQMAKELSGYLKKNEATDGALGLDLSALYKVLGVEEETKCA